MHTVLHFLLWPLGLAAVAAGGGLPNWIHALDDASPVNVTASSPVPAGRTRNVLLAGFPRVETVVLITTTTTTRASLVKKEERILVPIVEENWKESTPVRWILSTPASAMKQSDALVRAGAGVREPEVWRGSVRNVLWDRKLTAKQRALFTSAGVPIAADAVVVEEAPPDYLWAYGLTGGAFFMGLFVAEGVRQRKSKQTKPRAVG